MEYRVDWVEKYGKMGEKHTFWEFSGNLYRYTLNLYWYSLGSGYFGPTCTGTGNALFFYFDQFSYFGHNLLISYLI